MKKSLSIFFGTGFYAGLIPVAPGTFGTLSALIPLTFSILTLGMWGLFIFLICSIIGNYVCYPTCEELYGADPGSFVLDEWAGIAVTLIPVVYSGFDLLIGSAIGFALFRFFDIAKILGVNELQNLPDAHGVLFDDLLAGIYSAICLSLFIFAFY